MWRTIPLRNMRPPGLFTRGEFTVMAVSRTPAKQTEQLLRIFDRYFWSQAYGRRLNRRLKDAPSLRSVIVLPPWARRG